MTIMTLPGFAFVTGASSGIGRQVALSFVQEGCAGIALVGIDEDGLDETNRLCKGVNPDVKAVSYHVNVRNEEEVDSAVAAAVDAFGRIDYAVNAAGIMGPLSPSHALATEDFDLVTSTNYRGSWLCSRGEIKQMLTQDPLPTHDGRPGNRGVVVNISSNLALVSRSDTPAYNASKAAVVSLTRSDAIDYSEHNIRVNCVCPGLIDTPLTKDIPHDHPVVLKAPMKRMGTPEEVADAVLFLCSSKATFIQGTVLSVDGGYVIN